MKYTIALLAALATVHASPLPRPQGVTENISPDEPTPDGCELSYSGTFGVVAQNITAGSGPAAVSQIPDGQPQASTGAAPVSQIPDGQSQGPTSAAAPVSQISDGQPQGPTGSAAPITQISDGQPQGPTAVPVSQISDGQIQGPKQTMPAVTQIGDGKNWQSLLRSWY